MELVKTLLESPVANLFMVAGLVFLGIAVVGDISGKIQPGKTGRILSGLLGIVLVSSGLMMYSRQPPTGSVVPTNVPTVEVKVAATEPSPTDTKVTPLTLTPLAIISLQENIDTASVEYDMHVCPIGFAIGGANLNQNIFLCRRVVQPGKEQYVTSLEDTNTVRGDMHACPIGMYMRGIRVDKNLLLCGYDQRQGAQEWRTEFIDSSTRVNGMHVCPNDSNEIRFLTGVRADRDEFLCATLVVP